MIARVRERRFPAGIASTAAQPWRDGPRTPLRSVPLAATTRAGIAPAAVGGGARSGAEPTHRACRRRQTVSVSAPNTPTMANPGLYGLFAKGLRWSHRRYGLKGAAAFAASTLLAYYLIERKVAQLAEVE